MIQTLNKILIINLIILLTSTFFTSSSVKGEIGIIRETQDKLKNITQQEKEILEGLYTLAQEIEEAERQEDTIINEIKDIKAEIDDLEEDIMIKEEAFNNKRNILKDFLKSYQRRGAGTYIKIMLDSENLSMFIRRLNILRDLSRNTDKLLKSLEESRNNIILEKEKMSKKLMALNKKKDKYRNSIIKKMSLKAEKERYLNSLEEEKDFYQEHLANINNLWNDSKTFFYKATNEFSNIIEEGNFPPDALKLKFNIYGIKGIIDDTTFNKIISKNSLLSKMIFSFSPDEIKLSIPEKNLVLIGEFVIVEGTTLKFKAYQGSFYDMSLEKVSIEELFKEGDLVLNLKPLLFGTKINSIEIKDGHIELLIK